MERSRLVNLIDSAYRVFSREPQLIKLEGESFLVVGDTHGDLETSENAVKVAEREGLSLIFLGDYVDRGPRQIENIATLLELKLSWMDRLTMLRGNHESAEMNRWYGFLSVVSATYGLDLYQEFAKLFSQLPYAAVIWGKIFCVHGGVAKNLEKVDEVSELPKGEVDPRHPKAFQLVWNDPCEDVDYFIPSWRGGGAMLFGKLAFRRFMSLNYLDLMMRSHEPQDKGYGYLFDNKLLTVFSCRYYGIRPAGAIVTRNEIKISYLE